MLVIEDQLSGSNFHFTAMSAWVELMRNDPEGGRTLSLNWDNHVIADVDDITGESRGLIVWQYIKHVHTAFICLGWVDIKFRGSGVYSLLYETLKTKAKEAGALRITGAIAQHNSHMIEVAKKQGRIPTATEWEGKL